LRVIRDSDSTELDIGFLGNGTIDVSAINTFCSGTTGRVKVYYDQVGTNNLNGIGGTRPVIYSGGAFLGIISNVTTSGGFEFSSNFNTQSNFTQICSFKRAVTFINKRFPGGMALTISVSTNLAQITYYGVAIYSLTAKTSLSNTTLKKYLGIYHQNNTSCQGFAFVEGVDSGLLTSIGSVSLGTQSAASTTAKFGVSINSSGVVTGSTPFEITDLFYFSTNQAANSNIFDKRYIP
jgi:hypothetical protein